MMYLSFTSFGLQYALTLKLSTELDTDYEEREKTIAVTLTLTYLIAGLLTLSGLGIQLFDVPLFQKYLFNKYVVYIGAIAGINHCLEVFKNIYRIYNRLVKIAASELIRVVLIFLVVLTFKGENLISAMLGVIILSGIINIAIFLIRAPFRFTYLFDIKASKQLIYLGFPLLIYGVCFYLITVSSRTFVSIFYSAETMGYYSLAHSISNAALLGMNSIVWVFFPYTLKKTRSDVAIDVVDRRVKKINDIYGTAVFLAVFTGILMLPLLFSFLPKYKPAEITLCILLLSQAILSVSFGYNSLAIARKKQHQIAKISIFAVAIVVGLCLVVSVFKFQIVWIAVSVLISMFFFTVLLARLGSSILNLGHVRPGYFESVLPWGTLMAILICLISVLLGYTVIGGVLGLIIFCLTNIEKIASLYKFGLQKSEAYNLS